MRPLHQVGTGMVRSRPPFPTISTHPRAIPLTTNRDLGSATKPSDSATPRRPEPWMGGVGVCNPRSSLGRMAVFPAWVDFDRKPPRKLGTRSGFLFGVQVTVLQDETSIPRGWVRDRYLQPGCSSLSQYSPHDISMDTGIDERSIVRKQISTQILLKFDLGAKFLRYTARHNQIAETDSRARARCACHFGKQPSCFTRAHQLANIRETEGVN